MANTKVKSGLHKAQYRIPVELADWLKEKAEANTRTINGELTALLKEAKKREVQEAANAT